MYADVKEYIANLPDEEFDEYTVRVESGGCPPEAPTGPYEPN
jgi:hypothetical protein